MLDLLEADRAFVAENEAQILDLEAQITARQRWIDLLRDAQRAAKQRLSSYKYPVLTLPNEILGEIFMHFLPPYPDPPPLVGNLSPICLTHVCRRWRDVACKTPSLWRAIELHPSVHRLSNLGETLSLIAKWSARSGHSPLSIRMECRRQFDPISIFTSLIPHRARWEHLNLNFGSGSYIQTLDIDRPMPLLRSLTLTVWDAVGTPLPLLEVPLLRTVVINDQGSPSLVLPWSQLTSLTLRRTHPGACLSILREASQLLECRLHLWSQRTPLGGGAVVLPRLESLVFERDSEVCREFFESLVTPALRRLELPEAFLRPHDVETLKAYISKSGCTLQSLRVTALASLIQQILYRMAFRSIPTITFCE
ncbi:F-box domain-containing protein [Favolaschia claudopus]|uniref:F-box domain-containing protein n=1 Tax=Favolaschia claudopus TaxID=2862362 RepID=A0AAV9ZD51_9AGAR